MFHARIVLLSNGTLQRQREQVNNLLEGVLERLKRARKKAVGNAISTDIVTSFVLK